jgi:hypothetical protein
MKVFCFGFIVYLVMLLTQPCQDVFAAVNDCAGSDECTAHFDDPAGSDPVSDDCSPLCICACCSLSVADHSFPFGIKTVLTVRPLSQKTIEYQNTHAKTYQTSIWQPPKA